MSRDFHKKNQKISTFFSMSLNSNRMDAYLAFLGVERNLSPATIQSYQEDLRHFVAWLDDNSIDLKELTPEKLDDFPPIIMPASTSRAKC